MVAFFFDLEEIGAVGAAGAGFFVGPLDLEYGADFDGPLDLE
jgi:hypothetical protein